MNEDLKLKIYIIIIMDMVQKSFILHCISADTIGKDQLFFFFDFMLSI